MKAPCFRSWSSSFTIRNERSKTWYRLFSRALLLLPLMKRLDEVEQQKQDIETSIAKEKIKSPVYTEDEYRMALSNYRKVDITKQDGKRKIIDTFINAVYMYDDHMKIIYNGKNKEECISMDALENSSTLFSSGAP